MPFFQTGDWIQRPNQKSCYRVMRVRRDGVLIVKHPSGQGLPSHPAGKAPQNRAARAHPPYHNEVTQ